MQLKNISWNIAGLGGPLVVAAITIPSLIEKIGIERFGLLSLAWGLIGFAGIFDLGIGRATTQTVARLRGSGKLNEVQVVIKTASSLSLLTGIFGAVLLVLLVFYEGYEIIRYSTDINSEVKIGAYLLAMAIPIQSMSAMYRGVNEAFENFKEISLIRIGLGIANFLGPYCVALYTDNISHMVLTLLLSRIIAYFLYRKFSKICLIRELPNYIDEGKVKVSSDITKKLLSFGGWITVSSIISPALVQSERFFIGAMISAAAITTYTIPYEVVTQSLIIVGAISSVAFPSLSSLVYSQPEKADALFKKWLGIITLIMFIVTSMCALILPVILPWWIGNSLPAESISIGQILCIGIFSNSISSMYFALLHANGRADLTAKLHIVELPFYLLSLYFLIQTFGISGAAYAWVGRMVIDTFLLFGAKKIYLVKKN